MKQNATSIITNANKSIALLNEIGDSVIIAGSSGGMHAENIFSNLRLLLDPLIAFYSNDNNASYFPHHADAEILGHLANVVGALEQFKATKTPSFAQNATAHADQLYTTAMRFGLVSFGFSSNELKLILEEIGTKRKSVRKTAETVEARATEIVTLAQSAANDILSKARAAQEKAAESLGIANDINELRQSLLRRTEECEEGIKKVEIGTELLAKASADIEKCRKSATEAETEATEAETQTKASAKTATEAAKVGQSALESIQLAKAGAKDELDEIKAFYAEIELHQKAMTDAKKEADAKFNDLSKRYEELQIKHLAQTDKIVSENTVLQDQIKEHLQKAVGASLFHAFDARRHGISGGKWVWAGVMVIGVIVGAGLSLWLAESLKTGMGTGIEPAFFVKLSAVIPVTFAIIFASRQYSNERRTEEEYAFKSAISLSLEPYKDLLQKMKTDGHEAQAAFVEKLLLEIFDNPVSRVYASNHAKKDGKEKPMTIKDIRNIVSISKDLDVDKVRQVMEMVGASTKQ